MYDFIVKEYYLNEKTPRETESIIQAETAIEAIRSIEFWKHATQFTCVKGDINRQAHTQDLDGRNGCNAEIKGR